MNPLCTWDYTAVKDGGRDSATLLQLGLVERALQPKKNSWEKDTFKFTTTDAGWEWVAKVESVWEEMVEGMTFWSVTLGHGVCILGIPEGLHPEEVEPDLRKMFGYAGRLAAPRDEDSSPGNPVKLSPSWRPWIAICPWIDLSEEGSPMFRGAYMRPYGAPFDPSLGFIEGVGTYIESSDYRENQMRLVAQLPAQVQMAGALP